jgi:hypothetical protein
MISALAPPLLKALVLGVSLIGAWYLFHYRRGWIAEQAAIVDQHGRRMALWMLVFALLPIVIRLLLLPWFPAPIPKVHDEFSHLLVADTLNAGRLTNPSHPFWRHFETIYILSVPSYASIYPPGIGASLALGKGVMGHPWAGTLLFVGLFCAFAYWMLLGWIPSTWALIGGLLATVNFGPLSPWTETYFGGGVAALGGAILFGAIPRLYRNPISFYPAILVAGWGLIWFTRPYEAAVSAILLAPVILYPFRQFSLRSTAIVLAPALALAILIAAFFFYYNYRVTGSAWIMPYKMYQRQYGIPQNFLWQDVITGPIPSRKNIADVFQWQKQQFLDARQPVPLAEYGYLLWMYYVRYVGRGLPLLILLWPPLWRSNRLIPIFLGLLTFVFLASLLYPFRQPHYISQYTSVVLLLTTLSLQQISRWRWRSYPIGPVLVTALLATSWFHRFRAPDSVGSNWHIGRAAIQSRLEQSGEKHLIFVQYAPAHNFLEEWVYNAADIDRSPVVWAQPLDPSRDAALIRHFAGRKVWNLQPDAPNRPLTPLQ